MALHKISTPNGFTLIEILVSLAIIVTLCALSLFVSMDAYRGYIHRSEREVIISLLETARSRAMANTNQQPWGVCFIASQYVLFAGRSCNPAAAASESTHAVDAASSVWTPSTIVFTPLSASTSGGTIVITQDNRTATVTVNHEGTIDW